MMNVAKEVAALRRLTMRDLRQRYNELFDTSTNCNNKQWLLKRLIWRIQAIGEGDLSERAKRRAAELANDADLRLSPPKPKEAPAGQTTPATLLVNREGRLPPPGTVITRKYKGETLQVAVLTDGFGFEGERYGSLTAVAKAITGQHLNGFAFFRLAKEAVS